MTKAKVPDLSLAATGFIHCRLSCPDETDGVIRMKPGVKFRVRAEQIDIYLADEPGMVLLWITGQSEAVAVVGTVELMDEVMMRSSLRVVENDNG